MCAYTTFPIVLSYRNDRLMRNKNNQSTASRSSVEHEESTSSFPTSSKHSKLELKTEQKTVTDKDKGKEKEKEPDITKLTHAQRRALERERKHRLMLELISDPDGFFIFEQFLVSEFCNENLHFLRELYRFKQQCVVGADMVELEKLALNIEHVFILENSPAQINVSAGQRDKVRENLKSFFLSQVKGLKENPPSLVDQKSDIGFKPADSSSAAPPSPLHSSAPQTFPDPSPAPLAADRQPSSSTNSETPVPPLTPTATPAPTITQDPMEQLKDIFKVAEQEVVTMLFSGPWFRFLSTPEYLNYKKSKEV